MTQYESIKLNYFIKMSLAFSDLYFIYRVQDYPFKVPVQLGWFWWITHNSEKLQHELSISLKHNLFHDYEIVFNFTVTVKQLKMYMSSFIK